MTNRLKPLLTTYYGNTHSIENISTQRIEASGEYDRMCKQLDGPEFVRKWRTAEMRIVPDQRTAYIIGHHILCAQQEILQPRVELIDQPFASKGQSDLYPRSHRCKLIRELPEDLLGRLQPVFSKSALFDPPQKFQKEFNAWQKSIVSQLDRAERNIERGPGYQTRRFDAYREIFYDNYPVIRAWFDELVALLAEAGYVDHRMPKGAISH
jgi:hypothetical protein